MKKLLTNNIDLKIISIITAIIIWIVIVNIDDPVINKTFSGIQVEIINEDAISDMDKTYEIVDDSDVVSATVTAKRSIIENMSRDYIKATADLRQLSFMNTVPIEFKSARFSDQIKSISSKTSNVQVRIENKLTKQVKVEVNTVGEVAEGYVVGKITPNVNVISVSGPESVVETVKEARILVNLEGMNESFTNSAPVQLWDDEEIVSDSMISPSMTEIRTEVEILDTKEIPIVASLSGTPAQGFSATGTVICEPSSVMVAGSGSAFEKLSSITIPANKVNVDGAEENTSRRVNIKEYLPKGIALADSDFSGDVDVIAVIEPHQTMKTYVMISDIAINNVPEGYIAKVLHNSAMGIEVNVSGLPDNLMLLDGYKITGTVDASVLIPKKEDTEEETDESTDETEEDESEEDEEDIHIGINEGSLVLNLPEGVVQMDYIPIEIVLGPEVTPETIEEE